MSNSHSIPVRMPEDLYQEIIDSKPPELKISTYLLLLIRKGLSALNETPNATVESVYNSIQNVDTENVLLASIQARLAQLEEQFEGVQHIVDHAQSISSQASSALSTINTTVEAAVQKAVDTCVQFVDKRRQEAMKTEPTPNSDALALPDSSSEAYHHDTDAVKQFSTGLSQNQLANRLKCNVRGLQQHRENASVLASWTSERDPDGLGWRFDLKSKRFYPTTTTESPM